MLVSRDYAFTRGTWIGETWLAVEPPAELVFPQASEAVLILGGELTLQRPPHVELPAWHSPPARVQLLVGANLTAVGEFTFFAAPFRFAFAGPLMPLVVPGDRLYAKVTVEAPHWGLRLHALFGTVR